MKEEIVKSIVDLLGKNNVGVKSVTMKKDYFAKLYHSSFTLKSGIESFDGVPIHISDNIDGDYKLNY